MKQGMISFSPSFGVEEFGGKFLHGAHKEGVGKNVWFQKISILPSSMEGHSCNILREREGVNPVGVLNTRKYESEISRSQSGSSKTKNRITILFLVGLYTWFKGTLLQATTG